jgi:hypothetical protein
VNSHRNWQGICCLSYYWTNRGHESMAKSPAISDAQGRFISPVVLRYLHAGLPKSSAFLCVLVPVVPLPRYVTTCSRSMLGRATPDLPALMFARMLLDSGLYCASSTRRSRLIW